MMSANRVSSPQEPEYAWEIATLFPAQGGWSEADYFDLTEGAERRIEFTDGRLEFLPMPTEIHESLVQFLFLALHQFVASNQSGKVYSAGIRLRVRPHKIRVPDIVFLHKDHFHARHNQAWDGADLVMEIVSDDPKDRQRDYETKRSDYAEAGVAEYWIVDFRRRTVIVHRLDGNSYNIHGEYAPGEHAPSALLEGFAIDVSALFAATADVPE
jgi:Uma2 family endonuclease